MGSFIWPLRGYSRISSGYGTRKHPVTGKISTHLGIDIPCPSGTPVYAARSGTVTEARTAGTYGNMILLDHGGGTKTRYAHLKSYTVKVGQAVTAGQQIALSDTTGRVTGPHLHFEILIGGKNVNPSSYVSPRDTAASYSKSSSVVYTGGSGGGGSASLNVPSTQESDEAEAVIHIPQVDRVYTAYAGDLPGKLPDVYRLTWQSGTSGLVRDITDRTGDLQLRDDVESVCLELSFTVMEATDEKFMWTIIMEVGDFIAVTNLTSKEVVFLGQVQQVSGNYRDQMSVLCHDAGRLLTSNDVIMQFNNVPAKTALSQLANKVGIQTFLCPELVSSVYGIYKDNAASIARGILDTVTAENGVHYFLRMAGKTLTVRSYGQDPISARYRQEVNVAPFDIMAEASNPQVSWDIQDLRNHVVVYSDEDSSVSVLAEREAETSVKRFGRRTALETFSKEDAVTSAQKAATVLADRNRVAETVSLTTYGSDRVVAGCRLPVDLEEIQGEFWVLSVTHYLDTPHRMDLTLLRAED